MRCPYQANDDDSTAPQPESIVGTIDIEMMQQEEMGISQIVLRHASHDVAIVCPGNRIHNPNFSALSFSKVDSPSLLNSSRLISIVLSRQSYSKKDKSRHV